MPDPSRALSLAAALAVCACTTAPPAGDSMPPALAQALADLESEQARISREVQVPFTLEFADQGKVTVREFYLEGYPGNTWLRARFHYTNTTGRPLRYVIVGLEVLDSQDRLVASKQSLLSMPYALPFGPETIFADELSTKTQGVHRVPGWKWQFTCHAEFEEADGS